MNDIDARRESRPAGYAGGSGQPDTKAEGGEAFREPGWYRDPEEPRWHRYWNGSEWAPLRPARAQAPTETGAPAEGLPRPRREVDQS